MSDNITVGTLTYFRAGDGWRCKGARDFAVGPKFCALLDRLATLEAATHPAQASGEPVAIPPRITEALQSLAKGWRIIAAHADYMDGEFSNALDDVKRHIERLHEHPPVRGGDGAEESYWWCDVCSQRVEGRQVTYHEYHDGCGGKVREVTTPTPVPPVVSEAMVTAVARVICRKHADVCGVNEDDAWATYSPDFKDEAREYLHAASEPVSKSYTLPDTVQAIVDAAAAYEKKHGHYQDYRLSLRDDAFPVDKTERAIVVAYRKHAASEVRG